MGWGGAGVGTRGVAEMSAEKRIQYLLGAALRAAHEGDDRTARSLRRMAEEARELEARKLERRPERTLERMPAAIPCGAQ